METEKYWKIITGGIDIINKEYLVKKLIDVKLINNQIDELNLEIFHLINLIENDFARTKDFSLQKNNDDEQKRALFKEYTKKLVKLINKKKTFIFKKKIYSENYN